MPNIQTIASAFLVASLLFIYAFVDPQLGLNTEDGLRLAVMSPIFVLLAIVTAGVRPQLTVAVLASTTLIAYLSFLSLSGLGWSFSAAAALFILMSLWPELIGDRAALSINLRLLVTVYVYTCALFGIGLLVQYAMFEFLGQPLWNIGLFKGRVAMAFIWNDYSYASAYTASGALLALSHFRNKIYGGSIAILLILAALATTGRAGPVALLLFLGFKIFYDLAFSRSGGTASRKGALVAVALLSLMAGLFLSFQDRYNRNLDFSAAGRLEGYSTAVAMVEQYPMFGILLPQENYEVLYGAIPHNVFLHLIVFGGFFLLAGVLILGILIFRLVRSAQPYLREAMCVMLIALQFIPSLFSAYSLAVLIALSLLSSRQTRLSAATASAHRRAVVR